MKKYLLPLYCASLMAASPAYAAVETYELDKPHTQIMFFADHVGFTQSVGKFIDYKGEFDWDPGQPEKSRAKVTIDVGSLDMGDEAWDDKLKGSDFFDVANHPTITFRSTSVHRSADDLIMTGDLTIKGITRLVELGIEVNGFGSDPYGGTKAGFTASGELYRSDYGVAANAVLPTGGVVVSDEIQLVLDVEASLRTS